jgi:hypothetical protein
VAGAGALLCVLAGNPGVTVALADPLYRHETMVEQAGVDRGFDIKDKKAVFGFVFKNLPERVKVYPTEHYYYFKFMHKGVEYAGNMRFENDLRDQGKLHFAYAIQFSDWLPPGDTEHVLFERKDGIDLDRIDDWTYKVTYEGKSVVFELNKMEGVKPPEGVIAQGEQYLGPIFDDSAVRFFLVYNSSLKQFLYILDETGPATDGLITSKISDRILIGQRTGFAFYRDHKLNRRILIGVYEGNARVNNYYDGPFDQLPDNFLEGDVVRRAILEVDPSLKGKLDRFGSSFDGETRYMIAPYLHYNEEQELAIFHRCATNKRVPADRYYDCFVLDESNPNRLTTVGERELGERAGNGTKKKKKRNR